MLTAIKGNFVQAPALGRLQIDENSYLVLDSGRILGVFPVLPDQFSQASVTDFGNRLILQSFGDMHLHAPQYPMLGMGMDLPLLDWLKHYVFPTEARFADLTYARGMYHAFARELVSGGTTRVSVFGSLHTDATLILMDELEKAGITGYAGKVNMDRNGAPDYQETTESSVRETLRWLDHCDGFSHIRPIITPRFTPACSDALMRELGAIAGERGLRVQSHLSESRQEIEWVHTLHPECGRYWETYDRAGLFCDHTLMAHCVFCDESERAAMKDRGVFAVHCADSNFNIISGVCPVRTYLSEGIPVLLGSDIAGGSQLSMTEVIAMSIRASKVKCMQSHGELPFLTVAEGYYLGASAPAEYCGDHPGFFAGDLLHAVVIDDSSLPDTARLSVAERFERCFYRGGHDGIVAVFAAGRRIK